ncbi:fimbrial protein [Serratia ureilytica]|uniref:fimbrial protein n=2 Tax=Serratia TaxID=613 RepID=UPI0018D75181|nr:fimbrial protein [Serratia ureilytica]MBH3319510.1 fimbrial protein [Serratia ureilytica]
MLTAVVVLGRRFWDVWRLIADVNKTTGDSMMKIGNRVIAHLGLCGVLLAGGRGALAMECHLDSENGITEESENIGALTVPVDLPLGSRLWTSKIMTRSVVCWAEGSTEGEWVYFYGNPVGDVVRPGIGMGLIYNDADLGIVKAGSKVQTDMWRLNNKPEKGQVKYQIYLEKTGEIKEGGNDRVAVFQLDGVGGINGGQGTNYRYILQGMAGIKVSSCSVTINVPREIDFGVISSFTASGLIATKPLSVTAVKNQACDADSKLAVALIFSSPGGGLVESNTALDLGNGTYFSIKDQERKIAFETPVKFWDNVQSGSQQTVTYQTELRAREVLKMGVAAKSIVLYANYR